MVEACSECAYFRPSNPPEPLIQMDHPSRPFEMVSADFFSYGGHEYLVYTCRFSGFPFIQRFHAPPTASTLIRELRWLFSVMGVPNVFRSDNATVFSSSVCQDFFRLWGVQWRPSSPHHPQSNGHAEANVKSLKYLLAKCGWEWRSDQFQTGLLELRNTPRSDGLSPAQRVFGRPLRSKLPIHWRGQCWRAFCSDFQARSENADSLRWRDEGVRKAYFDRTSRVRQRLPVGECVLVQDPVTRRWDKHAIVVDNRSPRRYGLRFPSGRCLERNIRFLRRAPPGLTQHLFGAFTLVDSDDVNDANDANDADNTPAKMNGQETSNQVTRRGQRDRQPPKRFQSS
ncbi:uncharacterized protein LOC131880776 [Tigriopus californicus]|uniref:uncharacterized protein LOC131880776 n=1 Tax=Tigriopus californicus TaxID=6832 RepID=UPI0027DA91FA|nr:uncharacterized protein LOC131880776 [Tigriopus californicus]